MPALQEEDEVNKTLKGNCGNHSEVLKDVSFQSLVSAKLSELEVDLVAACYQLANDRESRISKENLDLRAEIQQLRLKLPQEHRVGLIVNLDSDDPELANLQAFVATKSQSSNHSAEAGTGVVADTKSRPVLYRNHSVIKEEFQLLRELMEEYANDEVTGSDHGYVERRVARQLSYTDDKHMIDPGSTGRLCWDLLGIPVLSWDLITIPLQVFESSFGLVGDVVQWIIMLYWTIDLPLTFRTGTLDAEGNVCMNSRRVARNYLRGLFFLDLAIVLSDWITIAIETLSSADAPSAISNLSVLRFLRITRFLRLMRLKKLKARVQEIQDGISNEYILVFWNMFFQVINLLLINHYIGCGWYYLGSADWIAEPQFRWLMVYKYPITGDYGPYGEHIVDASFGFRYTTSLHWAIAQFTPGPQNIQAQNWVERLYTVFVLLFGLVIFSSFIAAVTHSRLQMAKMMSKFERDFWLLRKFSREHDVSKGLQTRMRRYIDSVVLPAEHRLSSKDCVLITKLSPGLRHELQAEITANIFRTHPLFGHIQNQNRSVSTHACWRAVEEVPLASGDVAFVGGQKAQCMFMVTFGYLDYIPSSSKHGEASVCNGEWSSEAVIWTKWVHQGQLQASVESKTATVDGAKFRKVLIENALVLDFARQYGNAFCNGLNEILKERGMPSDLESDLALQYFAVETG